jgi:uncharacterized protein (DUF433 family)
MLSSDPNLDILDADDVRVRGTRVGIEHLLSAYHDGSLAEEIAVQFPTVSLAQVHGVIAYYLNHRAEVDEYLRQWRDHADQARREQAKRPAPEVVKRLRQIASQ